MKLAILSAAAVLTANAAFAGGYQAPVVETAPAPLPVVETAPQIDWTGFYAGVQYGRGDADASRGSASADLGKFDAYGLHGGYQRDMGQYVLGGEMDYNRLKADDGDADLWRLKGRVGTDLGKFQPYVTAGLAHLSADDVSENALMYGVGADYMVTNRFTVGAEYTRQDFKDVGNVDGLDLDANALQLRASFRF